MLVSHFLLQALLYLSLNPNLSAFKSTENVSFRLCGTIAPEDHAEATLWGVIQNNMQSRCALPFHGSLPYNMAV